VEKREREGGRSVSPVLTEVGEKQRISINLVTVYGQGGREEKQAGILTKCVLRLKGGGKRKKTNKSISFALTGFR